MAYLPNTDKVTGALIIVDNAHHEIHEGKHFFYTDSVTLASAGVQNYLITTGAYKTAHMILVADGSAITTVEVYEATDKVGTTLQTTFNSNRLKTNVAESTIHKDISGGTTDGVKIFTHKGGTSTGAFQAGTETRGENEIILKKSTKYIVRITSGTVDNLTNVKMSWYEN